MEMKYVGVWPRFAAVVIDSLILTVLGWVLAAVFGGAGPTGFELTGGPAFLYVLASFAYFIVLEATRGATVGKQVLGLRVVGQDGSPIDWRASAIRNVLRIVDWLPFLYLVGAILVWTSKTRQRLGDRVGGTVVVRAGSLSPGSPLGEPVGTTESP